MHHIPDKCNMAAIAVYKACFLTLLFWCRLLPQCSGHMPGCHGSHTDCYERTRGRLCRRHSWRCREVGAVDESADPCSHSNNGRENRLEGFFQSSFRSAQILRQAALLLFGSIGSAQILKWIQKLQQLWHELSALDCLQDLQDPGPAGPQLTARRGTSCTFQDFSCTAAMQDAQLHCKSAQGLYPALY